MYKNLKFGSHIPVYLKRFHGRRRIEQENLFSTSYGRIWKKFQYCNSYSNVSRVSFGFNSTVGMTKVIITREEQQWILFSLENARKKVSPMSLVECVFRRCLLTIVVQVRNSDEAIW
jgi:hypothetical protein